MLHTSRKAFPAEYTIPAGWNHIGALAYLDWKSGFEDKVV